MRFAYVIAILFAASPVLAQTTNNKAAATVAVARAKLALQAPTPPQAPPIKVQEHHGWTDLGNGYQRHISGYLYSPVAGVYWPRPVMAAPMFQPMNIGFANCGPSG